MFKIPISIPQAHLDTSVLHHRTEVKRHHLQDKHNAEVYTFHKEKYTDWYNNKIRLEHLHEYQDYLAINQYLNLKRHIEYGLFRYSITLGNNLDVYV